MGTYEQLKASITAAIKSNGNQEITGAVLQSILLSIVNTIGSGAVFKGVATPTTNPGNRDENCFYLAGTAGTYSNFNSFVLNEGIAVLENSSGTWVGTKILSIALKADVDAIGGSRHLKYNQAPLIALYNTEPIATCSENNKLWFKTDGHLYYRQNDIDYDLGTPAYMLYYCGMQIYKWNGSGFTEMNSGGGEPVNPEFNTGENIEDINLFGSRASLENKTDDQLALMMPTGAVIKALFDAIDSIDTSGGTYDGIDQVVTFSFVASTRTFTLKQSGRNAKTLILPLASTSAPGLMSAQDKTDLYNTKNKVVTGISYTEVNGNLVITLTSADNTTKSVTLPTKLKANLVGEANNLMLSFSEWPKCIIRNIAYEGFDYSSLEVGDVYYDENTVAPYKRLYYKATLEGNPINLGLPQEKVIYYCEMTQKFYKFVANSQKTSGSFVEISQSGGSSSGIADDLETDDATVALSAAQGVLLKSAIEQVQANIQRLYNNLGNVAFWDAAAKASAEPVDISWDGESQNPYQVPENGEMVFWLDGRDLVESPTQWVDKIGGFDFANYGGTLIKDSNNQPIGMRFNGTNQRMTSANDLPFSPVTHTIEIVCKPIQLNSGNYVHLITSGTVTDGTVSCIHAVLAKPSSSNVYLNGVFVDGSGTITGNSWKDGNVWAMPFNLNEMLTIGANRYHALENGVSMRSMGVNHWSGISGNRGTSIGAIGTSYSESFYYSGAEIYAIRIHRGFLTAAQMLANQKIDNERYSLGLTLPNSVS